MAFPSAVAGPSFAAAAGRPSSSSACGGVSAEVELGPGASVVDCDVEDAVAFASWSTPTECRFSRTFLLRCQTATLEAPTQLMLNVWFPL